jgi:DUF971 family protein
MNTPQLTNHQGPMSPVPISISRDAEDRIVIQWSDDATTLRTASQLREACPCATCREKKRGEADKKEAATQRPMGLPILSKAEAQPLRVDAMSPVGSYAYQITFSDGHSSGIYPFALLRDA